MMQLHLMENTDSIESIKKQTNYQDFHLESIKKNWKKMIKQFTEKIDLLCPEKFNISQLIKNLFRLQTFNKKMFEFEIEIKKDFREYVNKEKNLLLKYYCALCIHFLLWFKRSEQMVGTTMIKNGWTGSWRPFEEMIFKVLMEKLELFYEYKENMMKRFLDVIPIEELLNFLESNNRPRPLTFRINPLRNNVYHFSKILEKSGALTMLKSQFFDTVGVIRKTNVNLGSNSLFLAGYFTLQGLASQFPALSLSAEKGERICDIAAAPGGKCSHISQIMENTGICVANDINSNRLKSLISYIHRLGIENTIITNYDGIFFHKFMKGFDKILLDAPCTGSGIISHDIKIKSILRSSKLLLNTVKQKRLLLAAIDTCAINGIIVYSTCSVLAEENECVVQHVLERKNVTIIETGLDFGLSGLSKYKNEKFNKNMHLCVRFFPHIHNIDGFFYCKLKKNG